jgi:cytoskeleton protein RodZ
MNVMNEVSNREVVLDEQIEDTSRLSIGQRLSQYRQQAQLTQKEIAQRLRLPFRVICALEESKFAEYPGVVFMRGYVRAYLRLLKVSPHEILDEFDKLAAMSGHAHPKIVSKVVHKPKRKLSEKILRWASIGVVVLSMGMATTWWYQHRVSPAQSTAPVFMVNEIL